METIISGLSLDDPDDVLVEPSAATPARAVQDEERASLVPKSSQASASSPVPPRRTRCTPGVFLLGGLLLVCFIFIASVVASNAAKGGAHGEAPGTGFAAHAASGAAGAAAAAGGGGGTTLHPAPVVRPSTDTASGSSNGPLNGGAPGRDPAELREFLDLGPMRRTMRPFQALFQEKSFNGTVIMTIAMLNDDGHARGYGRWAKNWDLATATGLPPEYAAKRLLLGVDQKTCDLMSAVWNVHDCRPIFEAPATWFGLESSRHLTYKYLYTWIALSLGYRVMWLDLDVALGSNSRLLDYLTTWRLENGDGVTLPDLQVLSDITSYDPLTCNADVTAALAAGSCDWRANDLMHLVTRPGGQPYCGMLIPYYGGYGTCLSSGFWYAVPTVRTLSFFSWMIAEVGSQVTHSRPEEWEQRLFNQLIITAALGSKDALVDLDALDEAAPPPTARPDQRNPLAVPWPYVPADSKAAMDAGLGHPVGVHERLWVVVLDPRVFGNAPAYDCSVTRFPPRADDGTEICPLPPDRHFQASAMHFGFDYDDVKITTAARHGFWYVK